MTEISFHFNVPDRLSYACRLLRKASRKGARLAVTGPTETLAALDRALWTFDATDFVPHVRLSPGASIPPRLRATPIWLVDSPADSPEQDVLVNLGPAMPVGFESFARVIEIVSSANDDRENGRERWKFYTGRGYSIARHEVNDER